MKPSRLHVMGASGSGTTTLAKALGLQLGWKVIDADDYYWLPTVPRFRQKRDGRERQRLILADLLAAPQSITAGSVMGWGPGLENAFDLIVGLSLPAEIRLQRLRDREIQRQGWINEEFIAWAALYDDGDVTVRSRRRVEKWLGERAAPILRLDGDLTVEARVAAVLAQL